MIIGLSFCVVKVKNMSTHLFVYYAILREKEICLQVCFINVFCDYKYGKTNTNDNNSVNIIAYIPVSYTHLDVYKRQI